MRAQPNRARSKTMPPDESSPRSRACGSISDVGVGLLARLWPWIEGPDCWVARERYRDPRTLGTTSRFAADGSWFAGSKFNVRIAVGAFRE